MLFRTRTFAMLRRLLAALLCITVSWTPWALSWAGSAQDAQQMADDFVAGFEMPSMNNGAVMFPDSGSTVQVRDLFPGAGDPTNLKNLFGDDAGATAAGLTAQIKLSTEDSPQGEAYRTAVGLFKNPQPDMTNAPIFKATDSVYADIAAFKQDFQDCTLTTTFTEGTTDGHIPDYRTCEKLVGLGLGPCDIVHPYAVDPASRTLVDASWTPDSCVNSGLAVDRGICPGSYQCEDEPVPGPMTLDTVTVSVGAMMFVYSTMTINLVTGAWTVDDGDAEQTIVQLDHTLNYDTVCPGGNVVVAPLAPINWTDVPLNPPNFRYDNTHCAQVLQSPSCDNGLTMKVRLLDNCDMNSVPMKWRYGKHLGFEFHGGNCMELGGVTVCDPTLPQGPLANVPPLCRKVSVDPQCDNFNVGQMDCWTDPDGVEHCPFNDGTVTDNCGTLENNPNCAFVSEECVEGAERNGTCYVNEQTWDCGEDVGIPTLQRTDELDCEGNVQCMGGSCVALPDIPSAESDFYQAAALLQAAQYIGLDTNCADPQNFDCEIFVGTAGECKKAVGGVVDCCEKPDNVSLGDYVTLLTTTAKLGELSLKLDPTNPIRGAWQTLRDPVVETWDAGKSYLSSALDTLTGTTTPVPGSGTAAERIAANGGSVFLQNMMTNTAEWVAKSFGPDAASMIFAAKDGTALFQSGTTIGQNVTVVFNPALVTVFSAVMWAYTIYSVAMLLVQLIWECEQEEFELNAKRKLASCHKVGSYCKDKVLGQCVEKRESYCCYNSPLARIIQEEVHKQPAVGMTWGDEENPNCDGLQVGQLATVNWGAVDLSEWIAILQASGQLNSLSNLNLDALTGPGSAYNVDGTRTNTADRTRTRLQDLDANTIRSEAEQDLRDGIDPPCNGC